LARRLTERRTLGLEASDLTSVFGNLGSSSGCFRSDDNRVRLNGVHA
jgi:hypothetical protein